MPPKKRRKKRIAVRDRDQVMVILIALNSGSEGDSIGVAAGTICFGRATGRQRTACYFHYALARDQSVSNMMAQTSCYEVG